MIQWVIKHVSNQANVVSFEQIAKANCLTEFDNHRGVVNNISEERKEVSSFGSVSYSMGTFFLSC